MDPSLGVWIRIRVTVRVRVMMQGLILTSGNIPRNNPTRGFINDK